MVEHAKLLLLVARIVLLDFQFPLGLCHHHHGHTTIRWKSRLAAALPLQFPSKQEEKPNTEAGSRQEHRAEDWAVPVEHRSAV